MNDASNEDAGGDSQDTGGIFEAEFGELDSVTPRMLRAFWTAYPLDRPHFSRRQRLWRAATAAAAVVLLGVLLLAGMYAGTVRRLFEPAPPLPTVLHAARDGLVCVSDIAWSPDGRRIAVAGYANNGCGAETYATPLVLVYDARTGRLTRRIQPEVALLPALHALLPSLPLPGVSPRGTADLLVYENFVLWSPSGDRLGLVFLAVAYPQTGWTSITGVFTAGADGSQPRAFVQLLDPATPVSDREWDIGSGVLLAGRNDAGPYRAIPAALAYTWGASGDLAPQEPLAENVVPPAPLAGPVGSPIHDATFSVWQPGAVISVAQWDGSGYSGGFEWNTRFAAWSPDGRYLVNLIHVLAFLSVGGATVPRVAAVPTDQGEEIVLPVRDAALLSLLHAAPPEAATGEWEVAWRPDGRELAAFRLGNEPAYMARIYDCATGRVLASLPLAAATGDAFVAGTTALVRWSPDGSHLVIFSPQVGSVAVWGPNYLPR